MGLEEIQEIKQTTEESVVNQYLKEGFKIVKIISRTIVIDGHELKQPTYILARGENAD